MSVFRTQHARTGGREQPFLPGIPDDDSVIVGFSLPRVWKRRGVLVGRWFVPLGKWKETR